MSARGVEDEAASVEDLWSAFLLTASLFSVRMISPTPVSVSDGFRLFLLNYTTFKKRYKRII